MAFHRAIIRDELERSIVEDRLPIANGPPKGQPPVLELREIIRGKGEGLLGRRAESDLLREAYGVYTACEFSRQRGR